MITFCQLSKRKFKIDNAKLSFPWLTTIDEKSTQIIALDLFEYSLVLHIYYWLPKLSSCVLIELAELVRACKMQNITASGITSNKLVDSQLAVLFRLSDSRKGNGDL